MKKSWNKTDENYLIENYAKETKEELISFLNRSWISIQTRASKLGVKKIIIKINGKNIKIWDDDSINYLKLNYSKEAKKTLINKLNRSWSSIQNKAFLLGISRDIKTANIIKLINESNEAYYWLGFIMADGHFSKTNQLQINLSEKDLSHLNKFATFIEHEKLNIPRINVNFSEIYNWLFDLFRIQNNKTYYPCDLSNLHGDAFFSFIIGFIDGDGCINEKGYLTIKCHKSWLNNLNNMISFLTKNSFNQAKINNENLAIINITRIEVMKTIKKRIIDLNLPILNRKWDRVDLNKLSKKELTNLNKDNCFRLFNDKLTIKEVIFKTNLSKSQVYLQFKNYKMAIKEKDLKKELQRSLES